MMAFDFKKEFKELYAPGSKPAIVDVPPMNFIAVRGQGDPNIPGGEYETAVGLLYAVATGSRDFAVFFLACVVVAGAYGAWSVNKRIFVVQAMPALAALAALAWA